MIGGGRDDHTSTLLLFLLLPTLLGDDGLELDGILPLLLILPLLGGDRHRRRDLSAEAEAQRQQ